MTHSEYAALSEESRKATSKLSLKAQMQIRFAYRRAATELAKSIKKAQEKGLSAITINAQTQLLSELDALSVKLAGEVEQLLFEFVDRSAELTTRPDQAYVTASAEGMASPQLSATQIRAVFAKINTEAVRNMASRIYADGYTYSSRIWSVKTGFEENVKEILVTGLAKGRDPVKLIKDIQVYVADGKVALAERWGRLERGTDEWKKRIPGQIDYRAQRLVRSEIHATVQATGLQAGQANPGATGEYQWVLGPGLAHCEDCVTYSTQRFTVDTLPSYPHPNCGCQVRPVLMDRKKFVDDLKRWDDGIVDDSNRYIDTWAQRYLNAA